MDLKSFFIGIQENGRSGGLFVPSILAVIFIAIFWKLTIGLATLGIVFWLVIGLGRRLSDMDHKAISAILFFTLVALTLAALAIAGNELLNVDAIRLVIPIAAIASISYSLFGLKSYLAFSALHKFVYFALPVFFATLIWIQFLFDQP